MDKSGRTVHQPIHPDVRTLLDPEYVAFHDEHYQYLIPDDQKVWDGSARLPLPCPPTGSTPVAVGSVDDIELGNYTVRAFTPDAERPPQGWPVFMWLHGGGWAVGDITAGNDLCALICQRARCVVVTVGYRLAPEHPFPAAFDDSVDALKWLNSDEGARKLKLDRGSIAIGGTSAGGQLAASLAMHAAMIEPPIKLVFQLLIVPVIDNTAMTSTIWASRKDAPWLTPERMLWYRNMYFTNDASTKTWQASPNLANKAMLATSPKTWVAISEQDLLAPEAEAYAEQLRDAWKEAGVNREVAVNTYKGSTHSILAMSGVLSKGKQLLEDTADQAAAWFS